MTLTPEQAELARSLLATTDEGIASLERATRFRSSAAKDWEFVVARMWRNSVAGGMRILQPHPLVYNFSGQLPSNTSVFTQHSAAEMLRMVNADKDPADDGTYVVMAKAEFFAGQLETLRAARDMLFDTMGQVA